MRRLVFSSLPNRKGHHHIAITRVRPGERTVLHTHDFPEFFLTLEGSGIHYWNGRRYRLGSGELVFIRAADHHQFECGEGESLRLVNLALAPEWWTSLESLLAARAPEANPSGRRRLLSAREAAECARHLRWVLNGGREDPVALITTVALLAGALQTSPETAGLVPKADLARAPEWMARLVGELEEAETADQPVSHWQRRSGRSPEHLARCCRKYLGCTLTDIVNRARLNRVKAELRGGGGKVATMALEAGFHNLGHFYRTFRRMEGCSPKRWSAAHGAAATIPR